MDTNRYWWCKGVCTGMIVYPCNYLSLDLEAEFVAKQWIIRLNDKNLEQNDISLLWALIYLWDGNACTCTRVWVRSILYICVEFINASQCAIHSLNKIDFENLLSVTLTETTSTSQTHQNHWQRSSTSFKTSLGGKKELSGRLYGCI